MFRKIRKFVLVVTFQCSCVTLPVCVFVQVLPFCMDTSPIKLGPTLLQHDFILTKCICNDHISK